MLLATVVGIITTCCLLMCCLPEELGELMGFKKTEQKTEKKEKKDAKAED